MREMQSTPPGTQRGEETLSLKPIFFYGSLRDREMLEVVLSRAVPDSALEPATVENHAAFLLIDEDYPVLVPAEGRRTDGVLLHDPSEDDLARIRFFEGEEYTFTPTKARTCRGPVEALLLGGTDKPVASEIEWDFEAWRRTARPAALEATREYMAHYGRLSTEELDAIWPAVRNRALQRVGAQADHPHLGAIRTGFGREDVETLARERAFTGYVAVEELKLRHRRFDGDWSASVNRSVVLYGDAVTVLPYDPRRDRVLLIEQFRPAPYARGDRSPWCVEVVAGRVDRAEPAAETARREGREEAGVTLGRLAEIGGYYPTPGLDCEHVTGFVGEADLAHEGGLHGVAGEDEDIRAFVIAFDEAMTAVSEGAVNTGPAIISLLWLAANRDRLRDEWG